MMLTRCGANVGTYEIKILRRALTKLTSHPERANFIFSGLMSIISIWHLSIGEALFECFDI